MAALPIGQIPTLRASEEPSRPAITCEDETVSRLELEQRANRLARSYQSFGVGSGDLVTIALPNSVEFYVSCLATWKLGATPQPVSHRLPDREREQIVQLAQPRVVVGGPPLSGVRARHVPQGFTPDPALSADPLPPVVAPSWKAMTSGGSTGRPKLIVSTEAGEWGAERNPFGMNPERPQLVCCPLYHNAGFTSMYGLFLGQQLIVLPRFDATAALDAIREHEVSFVQLVPTMLQRMLKAYTSEPERYDLSSLERVWHVGAPCPPWLREAWIDLIGGDKLFELYASTEGIVGAQITGTEWLQHRGSVGRPIGGEVRICDAEGRELPPNEIGLIYMRIARGRRAPYHYRGAESMTLPDGWETVGDLGSVDADGYLYICDRRTDMIVCGGANIYPAEVEAALSEHPAVQSCVVVGLPDDDLGQVVHAVVQASGVDEDELRRFLAERLVRYKVPRSFRFVDEPLRDEVGKVRRSAVRDQERALAAERG